MIALPSKKVLSILILTTALVVAVIIAFGRDKNNKTINFASNLVAGDKVSLPKNPNWQNELNNVTTGINQTEENASTTKETATDIISRSLISNYLALKQSGNLNQQSAKKLVSQTVNLTNQLGNKVVLNTKLNIVANNGRQSILDYGENLGNILKKNRPKELKNELKIISQAVELRDPSKINELDSVIVVYQKIVDKLIKMPVPQTFAKAHLDLTNGLKGVIISLTEMKTIFNDPIKSLSYMQLYKESVNKFTQAIKATDIFIIQNKIIYKQGSGGYYLLYGI